MRKMRYVVGGTLVLGIAAGVWLSDFLKGFGLGAGDGVGIGQTGLSGIQTSVGSTSSGGQSSPDLGLSADQLVSQSQLAPGANPGKQTLPTSERLLVKDRGYFWRTASGDVPATLDEIIAKAQSLAGDDDGIRLRIYRDDSARVTAVIALEEALKTAMIPESAIYMSPDAAQ